jgi:hypothetical protein
MAAREIATVVPAPSTRLIQSPQSKPPKFKAP